ncbi:MAG: hypothetical protein ACRBK7_25990 [Acidimicrobiales bacterium]
MRQNGRFAALWKRVLLLSTGAIISFGVMVWAAAQGAPASVQAGADGEVEEGFDDPTRLDDEGRFTGPGGEWPPQPKGAIDVAERPDLAQSIVTEDQTLQRIQTADEQGLSPAEVVAADQSVADALGARSNLIAAETQDDDSVRFIYYSLSNNQTVDVTVAGQTVSDLELIAPGQFQPELSDAEKQAAVDLARAHWDLVGDDRIDILRGYSILTLQQDGSYFDTRMVYVSFHIDEDSPPELLAWVDLATSEIQNSRVDR